MQEPRRIVVGLDLEPVDQNLTPGSRAALLQAQWLATRAGARLELVHAISGHLYLEHEGEPCSRLHYGLTMEGRMCLEAARNECTDLGVPATLVFRREKPWIAISRQALSQSADLAIVGRRNEGGREDELGSVALKLLRKCPSPVWVVDVGARRIPERVLAATELGEVGGRAVEFAALVCSWAQAELFVAHAWQVPGTPGHAHGQEDLSRSALHERAVADVTQQVIECARGLRAHLRVECSPPVRSLVEGVESLRPDLLVMGTASRGGVPGLLLGNTTEKVLGRVDCSLLAVKPVGFLSPIVS